MEWKLSEEQKLQYTQAIKSAQDLEANIGSTYYRLYKFSKMREDIDTMLKAWWDKTLEDFNLDKNRNYTINLDGIITDVTPETKKAPPVVAEASKPITVNDLK